MVGQCRAHPGTLAEATCARCGDYLCALCAPLSPYALCPRCSSRGTVDWEAGAERETLPALLATLREGVTQPRSLGARLSGAGQLGYAFSYGVFTVLIGALPLGLSLAGLVLTVADPLRLGLRSTSVLSSAVFVVLLAPLLATLLPALLFAWSALLRGVAQLLSLPVRFDVLARASIYGFSWIALPLLGPLLLPVAWLGSLLAAYGALRARAAGWQAALVLLVSLLVVLALCLLLLG